jgi:tetratricopeptide (TPR) repeat protein
LRATIAWSYDLLDATARRLLQRVAVFQGGWTIEGAESVCADEVLSAEDVVDALGVLVDHSLVRVSEGADGAARYRLLETIREFALEQLATNGDEPDVRRRHAHHYLGIAWELDRALHSAERLVRHEQLMTELDNFRGALRWTLDHQEIELALWLVGSLCWSWIDLELHHEARQWAEAALAAADETLAPAARGYALMSAADAAWRLGQLDLALSEAEASCTLLRSTGDRRGVALALECVGLVSLGRGEYQRAEAALREALELYEEVGEAWHAANTLFLLGEATVPNDPVGARALYRESLDRFRPLGDPWGIAWPLVGLGGLALRAGDCAEARARFNEALQLRRHLGQHWSLAIVLTGLGDLARRTGAAADARERYTEALALFRETGDREREAWVLQCLGLLTLELGDLPAAAGALVASLALREEQGHLPGLGAVLDAIGGIAQARGESDRAALLFGAADNARAAAGISPDKVAEPLIAAARAAVHALASEEVHERQAGEALQDALALARELIAATLADRAPSTEHRAL